MSSARLILALADGGIYVEIMRSLRTTAPAISRWKRRFEQDGIAARFHATRAASRALPPRRWRRASGAGHAKNRPTAVHCAARMGAEPPETAPPGSLHSLG